MSFLNKYTNFINNLFGSVWPGFSNEGGWIGAAISAAGAVLSGALAGGGSSGGGTSGEIKNNTVANANIANKDVLYRDEAVANMDNLAQLLSEFSSTDRNFVENAYRPFQQNIMQTNQNLLPVIERVAGATLEQNAKDLLGNDALKSFLRDKSTGMDKDMSSAYENLTQQLSKIPTTEERVGQALTAVESQFKDAGRQLTRDFASRGQSVSQASRRDLAFEKAKAKAGQAGLAAEKSRAEQIGGAQIGLNAAQSKAQAEAQIQGGAINSLSMLQQAQQAGLATPQIAGVTDPGAGLDAASLQSGITTAAGLQTFGTKDSSDQVTTTKKGIYVPYFQTGDDGIEVHPHAGKLPNEMRDPTPPKPQTSAGFNPFGNNFAQGTALEQIAAKYFGGGGNP